jgi:hypothetical protein
VTSTTASTNSAALVSSNTLAANDADPEADELKPPAVDPMLTEAEHILVDYLSVMSKGSLLTAGH